MPNKPIRTRRTTAMELDDDELLYQNILMCTGGIQNHSHTLPRGMINNKNNIYQPFISKCHSPLKFHPEKFRAISYVLNKMRCDLLL